MEYEKRNPLRIQQKNALNYLLEQLPVKTEIISASPVLSEKEQKILDGFFATALEYIINLPQHEYEEFLADIVVSYADSGTEEMVLNLRDKNRLSLIRFIVLVNNRMKNKGRSIPLIKFSSEITDAAGGFLLKNGTKTVDCTLETLLAEKKTSLSDVLLAMLTE